MESAGPRASRRAEQVAQDMGTEGLLVKKAATVDTLARVSVVVFDKTGVLSDGATRGDARMGVCEEVVVADTPRCAVRGAATLAGIDAATRDAVLRAGARFAEQAAIRDFTASACGEAALPPPPPLVARRAFNSRTRTQISVFADGALLYGNVETVLKACSSYLAPGGAEVPIDTDARRQELAAALQEGRGGLRHMAAAQRRLSSELATHLATTDPAGGADAAAAVYEGWVFVCMWGIGECLTPAAPAAVKALADLGLQILVATGDHPLVAQRTARAVGIPGAHMPPRVGMDCDFASGDIYDIVEAGGAVVFARMVPAQKAALVAGLQARGACVMFVGDGANDAPAIRQADVGVCDGADGAGVSKDAADVLTMSHHALPRLAGAVSKARHPPPPSWCGWAACSFVLAAAALAAAGVSRRKGV
eukprot:TRINITY_DN3240_c0_g3_i1.p1 TRINITY_DN3240_c0_g3~~TRINITY_DN3240_c0_g3_i1.p1  ORF type:complete len:422 (+),score=91.65 TRINITY_DN3240_c0_g3_i1:45-1310(+)